MKMREFVKKSKHFPLSDPPAGSDKMKRKELNDFAWLYPIF